MSPDTPGAGYGEMGEREWQFDAETAISFLPVRERVHTFLGFVGADWDRPQLEEAIREAGGASKTGPVASGMGHQLYTKHPNREHPDEGGTPLMFEAALPQEPQP